MATRKALPPLQINPPKQQSSTTISPSSSDPSSDLPFPLPLPRSPFLSPSFTPPSFLTTLSHRHQTLADLRAELHARSASIAAELLALVNAEYAAFLALGTTLRGADERLDEARLAVLAFATGVADVQRAVARRRTDVRRLLAEREAVGREIAQGRALLEVAERVGELEGALALGGEWIDDGEEDDDEDSSEGEGESGGSRPSSSSSSSAAAAAGEEGEDGSGAGVARPVVDVARLHRLVRRLVAVRNQMERLGGTAQPFLAKQAEKLERVRRALLVDLGMALKQSKGVGKRGNGRVIRILGMYSELDEVKEAMKVLKKDGKRA